MTYAVVKDNIVENMIVAHESQKEELETALNAELIDPSEFGLTVGDFWNGTNWTRNIDGEQMVLEPEPEPDATDTEVLNILLGVEE